MSSMPSTVVAVDLPWFAKTAFKFGRPIAFIAALIMSVPGEIHLAEVAGWSPGYARLMPVCVSVYAACAAVISDVAKRLDLPGRKSALVGAVAALVLAICAQDISHLIALDYMGAGAVLVAAVSAIPPLVVAHMMHMAAAPKSTATAVEVDAIPAESDEGGQLAFDLEAGHASSGRKRRGRQGIPDEVVAAAVEALEDEGRKVSGPNLAEKLGLSPRQARRYIPRIP
ncbi:hypothetical protein ACIOJE_07830 [Kitasatospora sp. NPDC087861]|uniref:hypothetical protein n=1 Tax=Kitasatospora sp. NPDC087861 TaxID=3364070 RepID=UPI003817FCA6